VLCIDNLIDQPAAVVGEAELPELSLPGVEIRLRRRRRQRKGG
jgi:hypothetical protein